MLHIKVLSIPACCMTNFVGPRWKLPLCALHRHLGLKDCWKCKDDKAGDSALQWPAQVQKLFLSSDWHSNNSATRQVSGGIAQLKNRQVDLCGPANMAIQWLYLKQSILCYAVSVSTLFSWAGRPYLALSVLIFQLLLLSNLFFMPLSHLMGAQNMPWSEVPPKLWIQLCLCPWRCREVWKVFQELLAMTVWVLHLISSCHCHARVLLAPVPGCCLQCRAARDTWTAGRRWLEKSCKAPVILVVIHWAGLI